ncbi:MAG: hypothetical protein IT444_09900 [Phycisphaeraceae bacterium]|nr:hypothetical protein [Phycisphaeraceae bacterium]
MSSSAIDWLILTAANAAQARGYTAQLRQREQTGTLGAISKWKVIADPHGRRVGSGGSTLWVLHEVAQALLGNHRNPRTLTDLFIGKRIIVIHSGGDSRRLAAYAAQGKVFTPLPCEVEGQPATLFDLIVKNLASLPVPQRGQVLLAAGDVLLTFDPFAVRFDLPGVVGVAYPGPIERGSRHGVYVADADGRVVDFLQKPDAATARSRGALDSVGRLLVDTGLVSLDPQTTAHWLRAAGVVLKSSKSPQHPNQSARGRRKYRPLQPTSSTAKSDAPSQLVIHLGLLRDILDGRTPAIDLYEQVLIAIPARQKRNLYLDSVSKPLDSPAAHRAHQQRLARLHQHLHGRPFHVNVLPWCDFFHIGSMREMLANVNVLGRTATEYGFQHFSHAVVADRASLEGAFVYNSLLANPRTRTGRSVLLEAVDAQCPVTLAGRNLVVGWPAEAKTPLKLPEGWGLVCLPLSRGASNRSPSWAVALMGVDDDFKTPVGFEQSLSQLAAQANTATFGNRPLSEFMASHNLTINDLWPGEPQSRRTLWEARLWCVGPIDQVLKQTLWMCNSHTERSSMPRNWLRERRMSMEELIRCVDHGRLLNHRADIQRKVALAHVGRRLVENTMLPAQDVLNLIRDKGEARCVLTEIDSLLRNRPAAEHARFFKLSEMVRREYPRATAPPSLRGDLPLAASDAIARAVAQHIELPQQPSKAAILPDQAVWVTTPVRIDLSGGWSDTPPICTELGGAVVNAAIMLNGQYPVQVMAKLREEPAIVLNSIDLGRSVRLTDAAAIQRYQDPTDWAALPKAALILAGICPRQGGDLKRWLKKLGGGLDITLFSALPKGSGLGTSSVLGAAMLAGLARVVGESLTSEQLIARTSLLEQFMTTGGGWQDQVGGITPGVKLIRTHSGADQSPSLHWTVFDTGPTSPFHGRLLLYYTGYRRLARNILRNVVGRYLARDPQAVRIIHELKDAAEQMKMDLDSQNLEAVGRGVERYWELKKRLDPGSTNPQIESLLRPIQRDLIGKVLPGAGGGGFVFMVARDTSAAQRVRRVLDATPPNPLARFFDFNVDAQGLRVTVL